MDNDQDQGNKKYIVFDSKEFIDEKSKGGDPSHAILGIVKAPDTNHAQDTASTRFPDRTVFVRDRDEADQKFIDAADKMGYLNKSQAHNPLG